MRTETVWSGRSRLQYLLATALAAGTVLATTFNGFAADNRLQEQVLSMTAQLNGNCSATLISSERDEVSGKVTTLFLTAKHCVKEAGRDQVVDLPVYQKSRVVKKDRYIGRVHGQYGRADLALIRLKDEQTKFEQTARIAPLDGVPAMGDDVWTVGYPLGLQLTITSGLFGSVETINYPSDGVEYYRATPDIAGGNSGGGMYRRTDKGDYELIGVTTAGMSGFPFIGLYTPLEMIHAYLKVAAPKTVGVEEPKKAPAKKDPEGGTEFINVWVGASR